MHTEKKIIQPLADLVNELEQRNIALEGIQKNLEQTVHDMALELQAANKELKSAREQLSFLNEKLSAASLLNQQQSEIINQQKKQEVILRQSEANLRTIFDNTEDSFTLLDDKYNVIMANGPTLKVSPKFVLGVNILDIISDERREIFRKYLEEAQRGDVVKYEVEYGSGRDSQWYNITIAAVKSDGIFIGFCITTRNSTAIKKAEISLRESEERFQAFMDASPAIAWIKDSEGNYLYGNKIWNNLKKDNVLASDFMVSNQKQELEIINGNQSVETVESTKNAAGVKQYWNSIKFPIKNSTGDSLLGCFAIDISERKKYETEFQQNEILLNRTYDIAEMGYWTYNPDTNQSSWNEQASRIFGMEEHANTGFEGYLSAIHPEDLERVKDAAKLTLLNNKPYDLEYRIIRPVDGVMRWIHERSDFVPNDENSRLLLGVIQDITVRKKVEEILLEYNQRYEILSRATNDAIWDLDIEHDFELWNHGIQSIFGYSAIHIKSASKWRKEKIHPADYDRVQLEITNAFHHHRTNWTSQYRYLCASGNYKYVLDRAYIIYNEDKPMRMIGAMQDISEQREFEQHIIATALELSELIENANTPIFGTDRDGYINEWNKVTASLTGYFKNEVLGKKLSHFMSSTQHKNLKSILNRVSSDKPVSDLQIPIRTKDNRELTILLNATPRRDTLKNITGILMVGQNITELIEYRQNLEVKVNERTLELNQALSKEKELVEIKSRFVSIASHEFRTPLSTILIVLGFLRKHRAKLTDEDFNLKLNAIEKQVNHMTYLLDDILMIGKTEAGKITAQHNLISIKDFFLQIAKEVEESAKTHTVDVRLTCSVAEFYSDEKLLRNIIINLLTNAIKFSPNAQSVIFNISNSAQYLRLTVEDKGIGISEEDLKNLFTSFHRGSNVGDIQGTGLGLSIAKKAVDLLHGTIQISSKVGEGTQFMVNLPLQSL
ncbi:MAG TPA: PAS domain S-box protein [Cyclobacteriaceae bacterium]